MATRRGRSPRRITSRVGDRRTTNESRPARTGYATRPDRGLVDGLHDPGALQLAVVLARPEADPPEGGAVGVAGETRYDPERTVRAVPAYGWGRTPGSRQPCRPSGNRCTSSRARSIHLAGRTAPRGPPTSGSSTAVPRTWLQSRIDHVRCGRETLPDARNPGRGRRRR